MNEEFRKKLTKALQDKGIPEHGSGVWLAGVMDVSPKAANKWINGDSLPKQSRWPELARKVGKPENYFYPNSNENSVTNIEQYNASSKFIDIPYFRETHLSAGNGSVVEEHGDVSMLTFQKDWLDRMNLKPANLVVVRCKGDSMEPRICEGDVALVNIKNNTFSAIEDGKIYAINYGGEARIKRLIKRFDGSLIIRSDNNAPEHSDEVVTVDMADQLNIIGRVVWIGGEV